MVTDKPRRRRAPADVEAGVLAKSARRCALCFHLHGDLTEKLGQIAHLDRDRANSVDENLAYMCLDHHSVYDSATSQHKNYTIHEVKAARASLYNLVADGKHLTPAAALPYAQAEADKKVLRDLLETVPSNGSIRFLRNHDFAGSFEINQLQDVKNFHFERSGPDHEFLDHDLETARQAFRAACDAFLNAVSGYTYPTAVSGWQTVPPEWRHEDSERFEFAVNELHGAADSLYGRYDDLIRLARRKLGA